MEPQRCVHALVRKQGPITTRRSWFSKAVDHFFKQHPPRRMGPCFRRDDVRREYAFAFSRRDFARVMQILCLPRKSRAQGMPGARCTRGLVCQTVQKWRTRAYRFSGGSPTSPAQWLYGLLRALPGGAGLLSPSPAETPHRLSASIAAPGPHDFAVRPGVFVRRQKTPDAKASTASRAPRVVTIMIRPSCGHETGAVIILIYRIVKRNVFDSGA